MKTNTDLTLLAAAFAVDHQMAQDVCRLLTEGHITEPNARMMLKLVRDGHLRAAHPCTQPHYWWWSAPTYNPTWTSGTITLRNNTDNLTMLANTVMENAA